MSRTVTFEGRSITVPDDATDDEVRAILGGGPAAAPQPEPSFGQRAYDFAQGVGKGAFSLPQRAVELGAKGLDAVGLTDHAYDKTVAATDEANARALKEAGTDPNSSALHAGEPVGQFGASLPLGGMGAFTGGAAAGALMSDRNHELEGAALGGMGGKAIDLALRPIAQVIAPVLAPAVRRLREAGAQLTPGQLTGSGGIFGRALKNVEDNAAGLPFVGPIIRGAQNRSLETAGRGAINTRVLAPIGQTLPEGLIGQDAIRHAGDALSDNYQNLLPQMSVTLDAPFARTVANAGQRVDARLPDEMGGQFQGTLADVFKKLNASGPMQPSQYTGEAAHEAASDLGRMSRAYSGLGGNDSQLGDAFGTVEGAFRDATRRSNPQLGPQLSANDEGWANLVRLEDAAKAATGSAAGKAPGVFTGQQLRAAARAGDHSVRDRATARGDALLQDYAEDMIQVLPASVGDSGTAGRAVLPMLAAGALPFNVPAAAAMASIPAIYSRPGIAAINNVFARPNAGPTATALGNLVRGLGRHASGPVAASATARKHR